MGIFCRLWKYFADYGNTFQILGHRGGATLLGFDAMWLSCSALVVFIIIIITRPKPAYGRQGLAGSWGQDTDEVSTFLVFLTSHFAPAALSSDLTNLGPLMTMKIHLETFKNHGNQPKTMKNHETTLKNHGNQAKTMKPPWKTMETNQKP